MITVNTFEQMAADTDPVLQGRQYRFAKNGRTRYNRAKQKDATIEDALSGMSGDFSPARGTLEMLRFCTNYKLIAGIETKEGTVVFLKSGIYSQIGLLKVLQGQKADYTILYDDSNDPNRRNNPFERRISESDGDLLALGDKVEGYANFENEKTLMVYFVDEHNTKRVFNLYDFFDSEGNPFHFMQTCSARINYPKHMSVHAFAEQPDAFLPMLRFRQRVQGRLKSGVYRIAVRYRNKRAVSPWTMPGPAVFVTSMPMEADTPEMTAALRANHHNRVMGESGIETKEGLRWDILDVDSRWENLEVACIYYENELVHSEAYVFRRVKLYSDRNLVIDLVSNNADGPVFYPVTAAELSASYLTVLNAKHTADYKGRNWDANLRLLPDLRIDVSRIEFRPTYQYIREDQTVEPKFDFIKNEVTGRYDGDPLTNSAPETKDLYLSRFAGKLDVYPIVDDYNNYKGQQVYASLKGYFGGESQEFGVVAFDRKGNPLLVEPYSVTFPHLYENYPLNTLTRKAQDGKYDIRIMGAMFSGIRIPIENLYDKFGNLNLSGIAIVRKKRKKRLKRQGVIFPTVISEKKDTKTQGDGWVRPLPFPFNNFTIEHDPSLFGGSAHVYLQGTSFISPPEFPLALSAPYTFNFHSPDILIEETLESQVNSSHIKQVGHFHQAYGKNAIQLSGDKNYHLYTKSYRTELLSYINPGAELLYSNQGRPAIGAQSRIKWAFRHSKSFDTVYEKFDQDYWQLDYQAQADMYRREFNYSCLGIQQPGSVVMRASDFESVDLQESGHNISTGGAEGETDKKSCSYRLMNWYGPDEEESPNYFSTGYYCPLTPETLSNLRLERDATGKPVAYVIDEAEVFGGDCFRSLFDFTRIYSGLDTCKKNPSSAAADFPDVACSHIFPIESKYCLPLRNGRKFAANATSLARTYCAGDDKQFINGIMIRQPENWSYNRALLLEESFRFFQQRPADIQVIEHLPDGIIPSPEKIRGEAVDQYRIKRPGDLQTIKEGEGEITGLVKAFDYLYFIKERSFGVILANPQVFIPSDIGEVQVKTGDIFSGARKLGDYGTKFPTSIWSFGDRFGFVDTVMKKIVSFSQAGRELSSENEKIDDLVRVFSINTEEINPIATEPNDIISGVDVENLEVFFTFRGKNPSKNGTLSWSMATPGFVCLWDMYPTVYIRVLDYLLSSEGTSPLYLHNYGKFGHLYGTFHDTILRFVVNPMPSMEHIFTNGHILGSKSLTRRLHNVRAWTLDETHSIPYVISEGSQIQVVDDRFDYQGGRLGFPIHEYDWEDVKKNLKGHYLYIELTIRNAFGAVDEQDEMVSITSFETYYRNVFPNQY